MYVLALFRQAVFRPKPGGQDESIIEKEGMSMPGKITAFVFIILFGSFLSAFSQDREMVEVRVTDQLTEEPVPSATVMLYGDGEIIDSSLTDDSGFAELSLYATDVPESSAELPSSFEVSDNYPNPFVDQTRMDLAIPEEQTITAEVYNIIGQRIMTREMALTPGQYHLDLSLSHLSTGIYLVRLKGHEQQTVTITKTGARNMFGGMAGSPTGSFRISGGGKVPVKPAELSDARTARTSQPDNQASDSGFKTNASIMEEYEFEIRVSKEGYADWSGVRSLSREGPVEVALLRESRVTIVTVTDAEEEVEADLTISGDEMATTITTPEQMVLPAGEYHATGQSEEWYYDDTFRIAASDTTIVLEPVGPLKGVLLAGESELPVIEATRNLHIPIPQREEEIESDPGLQNEGRVLRTELEVTFDHEATVEQVNEFLERHEAGIVSMREGLSLMVIRFPDPGNIEQLNALIDRMESDDLVLYTLKSAIVEKQLFLEEQEEEERRKIPDGVNNFERIDHHLAIRGHGAWNARHHLQQEGDHPWLMMADAFGDGAPDEDVGFVVDADEDDFETDNTHNHGYHVLGIIIGAFEPVPFLPSGTDDVTGIFPDEMKARFVDIRSDEANTWPRRMNLMIDRINDILDEDPDARIIVNTSLNSRVYDDQNNPAVSWIQRVRGGTIAMAGVGNGLEHRFIHFTSAGNAAYSSGTPLPLEDHWIAQDNSMFAHAALGEPELSIFGISVEIPNLTNTFVVENRVNTPHSTTDDQRPVPGCAHETSVMKGNLSGIGTDVWSFTATWPGSATGTSMATPQAAGVAAWVWSLSPGLTVLQVKELINETTEARMINDTDDAGCNDIYPEPVIDAYAAVLRAGGEDVRRALLDVHETGQFDEQDLQTFVDEFEDSDGDLDYSRYDLNADGRTGGDARDRFDLTMDGQYGQVTFQAKGFDITYNEGSLQDVDILCYYAFSDLYEGDAEVRDEILDQPCGFDDLRKTPIAMDDFATVVQGSSVDINVMINDHNPLYREDVAINGVSDVERGTVELIEDNSKIRYTAEAGFTGMITFTYRIVNESGYVSYPATVTVTIWEGLIPYYPRLADDFFIYHDLVRLNDRREFIISGMDMREIEAAIFFDQHGVSHELGSLGGRTTRAEALNRNGVVVGQSMNEDEIRTPYRWSEEELMEPLPAPDTRMEFPESDRALSFVTSESFETMSAVTASAEAMLPVSTTTGRPVIEVDPLPRIADELQQTQTSMSENEPVTADNPQMTGDVIVEPVAMEGSALDINDHNRIAGFLGPYPMVWTGDEYINLFERLESYGLASAVNNQGLVAGSMLDIETEEMQGFLWQEQDNEEVDQMDRLILMGSLGGSVTMVSSLNEAGHAVGYSQVVSDEEERWWVEPFLWTPEEGMISLGTLGGNEGLALDINSNQQIVGTARDESGAFVGFLWMNGRMYDVNDFIREEGFTAGVVFDITDNGMMSVLGHNREGETEVIILEPDVR